MQATRPGSAQTAVDLDRELVSFVLAELPMPAGTDLDSVVAANRRTAERHGGPRMTTKAPTGQGSRCGEPGRRL